MDFLDRGGALCHARGSADFLSVLEGAPAARGAGGSLWFVGLSRGTVSGCRPLADAVENLPAPALGLQTHVF